MIVTHGIYLQYITVKAASAKKVTTAPAHFSISNDRAGVPPVSVHVIVRSAHSALIRKLNKPRSLFIVYDLSVCLRCVPHLSTK